MNEWQLMRVTPPVGVPIELRVHPEYERLNPLVRQWRCVQPEPAAEREPETTPAGVVTDARLDMCLEEAQGNEHAAHVEHIQILEDCLEGISERVEELYNWTTRHSECHLADIDAMKERLENNDTELDDLKTRIERHELWLRSINERFDGDFGLGNAIRDLQRGRKMT